MLYYLQHYTQRDKVLSESDVETNFTLQDFCYRPVPKGDCLIKSAMQYWHDNKTALNQYETTEQIKGLANCTYPLEYTQRACTDRIGTPVQSYDIFGDISCEAEVANDCENCLIKAGGLAFTYFLKQNDYSSTSADQWELAVFTRNIKSFNYALGNGYNDRMDYELTGYSYNEPLIDAINRTVTNWEDEHGKGSVKMMKADYLSHRSIQDNYKVESA